MKFEAAYARQRAAGFTCRVRKVKDEATAKRVLWAIKQNKRLDDSMKVKYCHLCLAWHITRRT